MSQWYDDKIWFVTQHCLNENLSSHLIYPLTARVVWAPQMISQPLPSFVPCSPLPSETWWTPGLSVPWCCLPTSSSICCVFFPLSLCLARWFWPDLMNSSQLTQSYDCNLLMNCWVGVTCSVKSLTDNFPPKSKFTQLLFCWLTVSSHLLLGQIPNLRTPCLLKTLCSSLPVDIPWYTRHK